MKFQFQRKILEKSSNIKFYENLSSLSRVVPCRRMDEQTDRYDGTNSRFSQFCEPPNSDVGSLLSIACKWDN